MYRYMSLQGELDLLIEEHDNLILHRNYCLLMKEWLEEKGKRLGPEGVEALVSFSSDLGDILKRIEPVLGHARQSRAKCID